jgi:nitrite reductase/ring-hydroxylating ferredoxin subunit
VQRVAQAGLVRMLEHFWHPVCDLDQVAGQAARDALIPVRLLGRSLVIARLPHGSLVALDDRCLHRSTPLSLGQVEAGGIRCAHHGWLWGSDGGCREVPGQPVDAVPRRARVGAYAALESHGLAWVQVDDSAAISLPPGPPDGAMVTGATENEPVGALRRTEHLLERFAPPGRNGSATLGLPERRGAVLLVAAGPSPVALGLDPPVHATVRLWLPTTVEVVLTDTGDRRRTLWAHAVPVEPGVSRLCWSLSGDGVDERAGDEVAAFLAEQSRVELSKVPAELTLDRRSELSSRGDRVSMAFRRAIEDLAEASRRGPRLLAAALRGAVA